MATTYTNTTCLVLCALLIACLARHANHRERDAAGWLTNLVRWCSRSRLLCAVLLAGGAVGISSHVLVGYLGPGDLFQDFVGAKEFAAGRSINPTATMKDRVEYWLRQEPLVLPAALDWPVLRKLQVDSVNSGARQLVVQAHPPFHILLVFPIVELCKTIQRTYLVMTSINLASYAALLFLLWRSMPAAVHSAGAGVLLCILALDWQPLLANLRQGQIGIVVALLVVGGWYSLSRDRPGTAGVLIGLAALIKMFPGLLILWLLARSRRAFLAALATICGAVLLVYLLAGPSAFLDFVSAARTIGKEFGRSRFNYSLSAVLSYAIAGSSDRSLWATAVVLLAVAALACYSAFFVLRKARPSKWDLQLEFSTLIVLACLVSPTCEAFYYPILLLPMVTLAGTVQPGNLWRACLGLSAVLLCLSVPDQVIWRPTQYLTPLLGDRLAWVLCSFPTFAILGMWYWTVRQQRVEQISGLSGV